MGENTLVRSNLTRAKIQIKPDNLSYPKGTDVQKPMRSNFDRELEVKEINISVDRVLLHEVTILNSIINSFLG